MTKLDNIIIEACIKVIDRDAETLGDYIDPAKEQIKALILELIGEDHDARQVDRGNEAYNPNSEDYIYGYNLAQSMIRKKVSEL